MMKQIMLVTDGESNKGVNPIEAAERACKSGIVLNTIGIVENKKRENPLLEIEEIALRGGGISEITNIEDLSSTLSMVTVRSVYNTIEDIVSREIKQIIDKDIEELPPSTRGKIVNTIDNIGDEMDIECLIILDTSGSMKNKINIAKRSILEFLRFMKERKGVTQVGVIVYPGKENSYEVLCSFTENIDELEKRLETIHVGGTTPTGDAILGGIELLVGEEKNEVIDGFVV